MLRDYDNGPRVFFDVSGRGRTLARGEDGSLSVTQLDFVEAVMSSFDLSIRCVEGGDGAPRPFLVADEAFEEDILDLDAPEEWPVVLDYLPAVAHFALDREPFWSVEPDDEGARSLLRQFGWCVFESLGEHAYLLLYATVDEESAVMMDEEMCAGDIVVVPIMRRDLKVV